MNTNIENLIQRIRAMEWIGATYEDVAFQLKDEDPGTVFLCWHAAVYAKRTCGHGRLCNFTLKSWPDPDRQ